MKKVILLIFIALLIYLNRSYAYFYDYLGSRNLLRTTSRMYEVSLDKTVSAVHKKVFKYVSLGDSLTAGVGLRDDYDSYPYLLATKLDQDGTLVDLYNYADPGAETKNVLNFQVRLAVLENPDLVTLMIGVNDIHNLKSEFEFKSNYQKIISELKTKTHAQIVLINIPYLGSQKILFFPYNILLDFRTKQFNEIIKTLSLENNLKYIDLYSQTKTDFKRDDSLYSADFFHPSDKGYILWGQIINANISK